MGTMFFWDCKDTQNYDSSKTMYGKIRLFSETAAKSEHAAGPHLRHAFNFRFPDRIADF